MRAAVLFLMMALLPWRAWVGDAMAMQMTAGLLGAIEIKAVSEDRSWAEGTISLKYENQSLPCHDASSASSLATDHTTHPAVTADAAAAHSDCAQCSTCQICHGVGLFPEIAALPRLAMATLGVPGDQAVLASVPQAPHLKPPIS